MEHYDLHPTRQTVFWLGCCVPVAASTSNPEEAFGTLSTLDEFESSQQPAGGSVIVLTDKAMEAKGDWVTSSKSHSWILSQTAI